MFSLFSVGSKDQITQQNYDIVLCIYLVHTILILCLRKLQINADSWFQTFLFLGILRIKTSWVEFSFLIASFDQNIYFVFMLYILCASCKSQNKYKTTIHSSLGRLLLLGSHLLYLLLRMQTAYFD